MASSSSAPASKGPAVPTHVEESIVLPCPDMVVFNAIKDLRFEWWPAVQSSTGSASQQQQEGGGNDPAAGGILVGSTHTLHFKDGVQWTLQVMEACLVGPRVIGFEIIGVEPGAAYTSALHRITATRVTSNNHTFISWATDFANDASADVILDSQFKKKEAFQCLAAHLANAKGATA